jgi:hypothetical protein
VRQPRFFKNCKAMEKKKKKSSPPNMWDIFMLHTHSYYSNHTSQDLPCIRKLSNSTAQTYGIEMAWQYLTLNNPQKISHVETGKNILLIQI